MSINIDISSFTDLQKYYDNVLNLDKTTYKNSNDEPTPINCIIEMISKIPDELWDRENLSILDPCCGNGNFAIPILSRLREKYDTKTIVENIIEFNDINNERLENVKKVFCSNKYNLQITNNDFLSIKTEKTDFF